MIEEKPTIYTEPGVYNMGSSGGGETVEIGGKIYPTVTINGKTWLAKNLAYEWNGPYINPSGYKSSAAIYYNLLSVYTYGYFYNWYAANDINQNNIIPGWHVPSQTEWQDLFDFVGGNSNVRNILYEKNWYNPSSDLYKFSIMPSGVYTGSITSQGVDFNTGYAEFCTSTSYDGGSKERYVTCLQNLTAISGATISAGRAIRLIKD